MKNTPKGGFFFTYSLLQFLLRQGLKKVLKKAVTVDF